MPNLISSVEQAHEIMQSGAEVRALLDNYYQDLGLRLAAIEPNSFRMLASNKEVRSYEDLTGLKLCISTGGAIALSYWAQWGVSLYGPFSSEDVKVAYAEPELSLLLGEVEADENTLERLQGYNEFAKYLINTKHTMTYTIFMMNEKFYQSLPDTYREVLDQAAEEISVYAYEEALAENETYRQQLIDAGMTYIELSDDDYTKMRENASEADEIAKEIMGEDLFNQMMAALGY